MFPLVCGPNAGGVEKRPPKPSICRLRLMAVTAVRMSKDSSIELVNGEVSHERHSRAGYWLWQAS